MTKNELLQYMKDRNPYPSDLFGEAKMQDFAAAASALDKAGIKPSWIFAAWGRKTWDHCIEDIAYLLEDYEMVSED